MAQTLEAANDILPPGIGGNPTDGAETYHVIQHSLGLKLAIDAARIFDVSEGRELDSQDKASFPVLPHHLNKPEVQDEFVSRARGWTPHLPGTEGTQAAACGNAIRTIIDKAPTLGSGSPKDALDRVRQLRTWRLAHSLFRQSSRPPPTLR